jgi:hypothetical protein
MVFSKSPPSHLVLMSLSNVFIKWSLVKDIGMDLITTDGSVVPTYLTTLARLTLIILFLEMLKFWKFFQIIFFEKNYWIFKNILFIKMVVSKLINYLKNICQSYWLIKNKHYCTCIYVLPFENHGNHGQIMIYEKYEIYEN